MLVQGTRQSYVRLFRFGCLPGHWNNTRVARRFSQERLCNAISCSLVFWSTFQRLFSSFATHPPSGGHAWLRVTPWRDCGVGFGLDGGSLTGTTEGWSCTCSLQWFEAGPFSPSCPAWHTEVSFSRSVTEKNHCHVRASSLSWSLHFWAPPLCRSEGSRSVTHGSSGEGGDNKDHDIGTDLFASNIEETIDEATSPSDVL